MTQPCSTNNHGGDRLQGKGLDAAQGHWYYPPNSFQASTKQPLKFFVQISPLNSKGIQHLPQHEQTQISPINHAWEWAEIFFLSFST